MNKLIYFLFKLHKWHKDWLGCYKCEFKIKYVSEHQLVGLGRIKV